MYGLTRTVWDFKEYVEIISIPLLISFSVVGASLALESAFEKKR
jgi:hypothetical protein